MKTCTQVPLEDRPRIVGLTASFCSRKRHDIEELLNAQWYVVN